MSITNMEIHNLLKEVGLPAHLKGYDYTKTALILALEDPEKLQQITKLGGLYHSVARAHNTTASRVERAIRHSVEYMFDCCPVEIIHSVFGNTVSPLSGKPPNSLFIATLRNELIARHMEG